MKRIGMLIMTSLLAASLFTGCGKNNAASDVTEREQGVAIGEEGNGETIVTQPTTEKFVYDKEGDFLLTVEDVFTITGRGTVATGRIQRGTIKVGDTVEIIGEGATPITTTVTEIEMFRETLDEAYAGDNVGIYLDGVRRNDIQRNQALVTPGTLNPTTTFTADVTLYPADQIAVTDPYTTDMVATYIFWFMESTGKVTFEQDATELAYGESATVTITLDKPMIIVPGAPLDIKYDESGIGEGKVIEILE